MKCLLLAAVLCSACATLQPGGKVNVSAILNDARWGVLAACDATWLNAEQCTFADDVLSLADGIAAQNLTGSAVAVRSLIVQWESKLQTPSRLRPYLDALIVLLPSF